VRERVRKKYKKVQPWIYEDWRKHLKKQGYSDERLGEYDRAWHALCSGEVPAELMARVKAFCKTESYETWKAVRLIMSRSDYFKVFSGPAFKAVEEEVFKDKSFAKHMDNAAKMKRILELAATGWKCYVTDHSHYESAFEAEVMDACEFELYRWCLEDWTGLVLLLQILAGENAVTVRVGIFFAVMARRMSGETNTSLGNGFGNRELVKFVVKEKGGKTKGLYEGDDGIFVCNVDLCEDDFKSLGFTVKMQEVADPCRASFCGLIFGRDQQVIRSPFRFLQKFGWTHSCITGGDRVMHELLRGKALSAIYETPHCPIVAPLAWRALHHSRFVRPRFVWDAYHNQVPVDETHLEAFKPTHNTRLLFEEVYGVTVEQQLQVEDWIARDRLDLIPRVLVPPADQAFYADRFLEVH
jgi:hypothetical protein